MSASPFSLGTRILAAAAALLALFLGVGWALPGTWSAEYSAVLDAPPPAVFAWVEAPAGWRRWTAWPDSGLVEEGPARGVGARLTWDDRDLGNGTWEIIEAVPDERVRYHVSVQDGAMYTEGTLMLEPAGTGTRVTWREQGDFGWNPLMGYWARLMERAQGREMEKALERLDTMAGEEAAPADAGSTGAEEAPDTLG